MSAFTKIMNESSVDIRALFSGRRVVAFGIVDLDFTAWLESVGGGEYEVFYDNENILRAVNPQSQSGQVDLYSGLEQIKYANGDVLFAEGSAVHCLSQYGLFKQYERLYVRPHSWVQIVYCIFCFIRYFVSGRRLLITKSVVTMGGHRWLGFVVRRTAAKRKQGSARIYLPEEWGYDDLFVRLNRDGVRYVVLRWWERLPGIPVNQDLDILTDDDHRDYFMALADSGKPGLRAVDVYTVSGIGHSAADVTYYEPDKARQILATSVDGPCGCKIPSLRIAFMALSYHALYHKGFYSGLPSIHRKQTGGGKFFDTLAKWVAELNIDVQLDMESLDSFLALSGWRPPADKLARLSLRNEWVRLHFFSDEYTRRKKYIGAFILRQECEEYGASETVLRMIKEAGFEVIAVCPIPSTRVVTFAEKMRGGNWKDGTLPAILVVAHDPNPQWITADDRGKIDNEFLDNFRMHCKANIRSVLNKKYSTRNKTWMHGCDNATESKEYIDEIAPDLAKSLTDG